MERDYGIVPQIEHYGCMIDLFARDGCLTEAFRLVHTMPLEPNAIIWGSHSGASALDGIRMTLFLQRAMVKDSPL
ncbi:Pentatricopeptide repeat-containing protein [Camellia lanceoleosa]|uniref:Pentatricopeptide repeat-containing protein n=1 Tax=Camellia lanceoleosa TaxID=1840588 RepID=A0ACC0HVT4_9ERIC|nr:Pentatricopeptide repeat-containing protein [Camellia lanceoleosa]